MAKVLFLYSEDYNEIFPTIGLVKELIKQGNEVIYYTGFRFKELLEGIGAKFMDYNHFTLPPSGPPFVSQEDITQVLYSTVFYNIRVRNKLMAKVFEIVKDIAPDYIIHNHQTYWGKEIAQQLDIPHICLYPGMVVNKDLFSNHPDSFIQDFFGNLFTCSAREFKRLYPTLNKAFKNIYGLEDIYDGLISDADLNIIYTSERLQPYAGLLDREHYKFVGYSPLQEKTPVNLPEEVLTKQPGTVYVSLNPSDKYHQGWNTGFYPVLMEALKNSDKRYILNYHYSEQDFNELQEIPANVTVIHNLMNHGMVIPQAEMVVTHGSFVAVHEALRHGIPVIVVPVGGDHFLMAKQIQDLQLGIYIPPRDFSEAALHQAMATIDHDGSYRANCAEYARLMQEANPDEEAARLIVEYIQGKVSNKN